MYIIFDTETSTFPNPNYSAKHPAQARVIQLAAVKLDAELNEIGILNAIIKPDNWKISQGAFEAHGISMERCHKEGKPMKDVLMEFETLRYGCNYNVAFNIAFDNKMLDIERTCYDFPLFICPVDICIMEVMTNICRLPHKTTRSTRFGSKFKWPKLEEAYRFAFNEEHSGAHDALVDVRATARLFRYLLNSKQLQLDEYEVAKVD